MNYDAIHSLEDVLYVSSIEEDLLNKLTIYIFSILQIYRVEILLAKLHHSYQIKSNGLYSCIELRFLNIMEYCKWWV